jgi:hypothetical protein
MLRFVLPLLFLATFCSPDSALAQTRTIQLGALNSPTGVSRTFYDTVRAGAGHIYVFSVPQRSQINAQLTPLAPNLDLFLFNSRGQIVAFSANAGTRIDPVSSVVPAGTYRLLVNPYPSGSSGGYALRLGVSRR